MKAHTVACQTPPPCQLNHTAGQQNEREPRASRSSRDTPSERIRQNTGALVACASPDRNGDAQPSPDRNRGDCRTGAHAGTAYPCGRGSRKEQHGKREDHR